MGPAELRIVCTYLEIYNEKMKDLLAAPSHCTLEVRQHPSLGIYVPGLTEVVVQSHDEVQRQLDFGNEMRSVAATAMNERSSRSHAVFTLNVTQVLKGGVSRRAQ